MFPYVSLVGGMPLERKYPRAKSSMLLTRPTSSIAMCYDKWKSRRVVHQADPSGWRAFHRPIAEPGAGEYGLYPMAKEKRLSGFDLSRELGGKNEKCEHL